MNPKKHIRKLPQREIGLQPMVKNMLTMRYDMFLRVFGILELLVENFKKRRITGSSGQCVESCLIRDVFIKKSTQSKAPSLAMGSSKALGEALRMCLPSHMF